MVALIEVVTEGDGGNTRARDLAAAVAAVVTALVVEEMVLVEALEVG
jgi:hypothetical protein